MTLLVFDTISPARASVPFSQVRALSQHPAPDIPGLLARYHRPGPHGARSGYLFADPAAARTFQERPMHCDRALAQLALLGNVSEPRVLDSGQPGPSLTRPIFILSAPRSGSTLLWQLLARVEALSNLGGESLDITDGIPALHPATRDFRSQALDETDADAGVVAALYGCLAAELRDSRGRFLSDDAGSVGAVRMLDKTVENALRVPFLLRAFPDARFIFLQRDVRQAVSSIVECWKHPGFVAFDPLPDWKRRAWCFLLPEGWRRCGERSLSEVAAFQWHAANEAILHALDALPCDRYTCVSFDELIADPAAVVGRLCAFMDVELGTELRRELLRPLPCSETTLRPYSPIKWKSNRDFDPSAVATLGSMAGRMRHLRAHAAPEVPRATRPAKLRFSCFIDELQPLPPERDAPERVADGVVAQLGASIPLSLNGQTRHRERLLPDFPLLWVPDPVTQVIYPYWLRRTQADLCALSAGEAPPVRAARLEAQLRRAGVLVSAADSSARLARREALLNQRSALERDRMCALPDLFSTAHAAALARYYRGLIASESWPLGDAQVSRRHGWHNERMAKFFHHQLTRFVSALADRPLKPSYAYTSAYSGGARLPAHTDREQCDYTLSLVIEQRTPTQGDAWRLWFQTPSGLRDLQLGVGDAVLFRGCELPHWRDEASPEHEQISLLFHFVPSEWRGILD